MAKQIYAFIDHDDSDRKYLNLDWNGEEFYDVSLPGVGETIYLIDQHDVEYKLTRR